MHLGLFHGICPRSSPLAEWQRRRHISQAWRTRLALVPAVRSDVSSFSILHSSFPHDIPEPWTSTVHGPSSLKINYVDDQPLMKNPAFFSPERRLTSCLGGADTLVGPVPTPGGAHAQPRTAADSSRSAPEQREIEAGSKPGKEVRGGRPVGMSSQPLPPFRPDIPNCPWGRLNSSCLFPWAEEKSKFCLRQVSK